MRWGLSYVCGILPDLMRIIICGCNGRMGKMVYKAASGHGDIEVVGGIDLCCEPQDGFPVFSSAEEITVKCDVIIDFSNPRALSPLLRYGQAHMIPLVLCTTGLSESQVKQIHECSKKIPIFFSRNMSIGINLLISLAKRAASVLGDDYDIEIVEKHHNKKIDAPSGTAFMIADEICKCKEIPFQYVYDRHCQRKPRDKNEIGIHSVRGGNIIGDHDVIFAGSNEVITLSHHAQSRDVFAEGAIKAAYFIKDKPAGLYDMNNLAK